MEHLDEAAGGQPDPEQIRLLCAEAQRALAQTPDALRRLRVHCLEERWQVLHAPAGQPQADA
jgi:hypothetical protein